MVSTQLITRPNLYLEKSKLEKSCNSFANSHWLTKDIRIKMSNMKAALVEVEAIKQPCTTVAFPCSYHAQILL